MTAMQSLSSYILSWPRVFFLYIKALCISATSSGYELKFDTVFSNIVFVLKNGA